MGSQTNLRFLVGDHEAFMEFALTQARKSPPAANKFCVGAVIVNAAEGKVLSTGYSLEYPRDYKGHPGTTHAEQCCFIKIAVLYTTIEPCNERLSGNMTCATRILRLKSAIKTVYVGIKEPATFIANNNGQERLEAKGVKSVFPVEHNVIGLPRSQWPGTEDLDRVGQEKALSLWEHRDGPFSR